MTKRGGIILVLWLALAAGLAVLIGGQAWLLIVLGAVMALFAIIPSVRRQQRLKKLRQERAAYWGVQEDQLSSWREQWQKRQEQKRREREQRKLARKLLDRKSFGEETWGVSAEHRQAACDPAK